MPCAFPQVANLKSTIYNLQFACLMESHRFAELLQPFLSAPLSDHQLKDISTYIDILLRWNARMNLTAVRQPEEIVTRHFGESLFVAGHLFSQPEVHDATVGGARPPKPSAAFEPSRDTHSTKVVDVGSGAGFPGLPIKIWSPHTHVTLIESNQKKATFLREVSRALRLTHVNVFSGRAEDFRDAGDIVTLRAVERFQDSLPNAARLVAPTGRLALLIGQRQIDSLSDLAPTFHWLDPLPVPLSESRLLLIGQRDLTRVSI
jgi:16S rRNA (guanine527-N7)-methyltransferase